MSLNSLFAQMMNTPPQRAAPAGASVPKWKCGIMNDTPLPGNKLRMVPAPERGQLTTRRGTDGMMNLEWQRRPAATAATTRSWIVFPGDVTIKRIRGGAESDRIYEVKVGSRATYVWSQEPGGVDADKEHIKAILDGINGPSAAAPAPAAAPRGMDPEALSRLLNSLVGGTPAAEAAPAPAAAAAATPAAPRAATAVDSASTPIPSMASPSASDMPPSNAPSSAAAAAVGLDLGPEMLQTPPPASSSAGVAASSVAATPSPAAPPSAGMVDEGEEDDMDEEMRLALAMSLADQGSAGEGGNSSSGSGSSDSKQEAAPAPSTPAAPAPAAAAPASAPVDLAALTASLSQGLAAMMMASSTGASGGGAGGVGGGRRGGGITPLTAVLDPAVLIPLVESDEAFAASLLPHMPPTQQNKAALIAALRSPQLQQAAASLTGALDSRSAASVFTNLGLDPNDGMQQILTGDAVAGLVHAVQASVDREAAAAAAGGGAVSAPASEGNGAGSEMRDDDASEGGSKGEGAPQ